MLNPPGRTSIPPRIFLQSALIAIVLGLTGCSGQTKISGQDPVLALDSMQLEARQLIVRVRISNVNDFTQALDQLTLELGIAGFEPKRSQTPAQSVRVAATSRETMDFDFPMSPEHVDSLQRLNRGEVERLSWTMRLIHEENRELSEASGYLFPVPGQSGRFR